ncbi:MAG TPA: alcohol dehydrogenase catalytic domain-containing protein [Firmicutes bacterium]|nr:alcohol dehydrogenase catalytic domain-containing protein [Candidatus Fermentithermobacillaceae bacterium]
MRAAFFEGPGTIVVRDTPDPVCPPGGLLTRVEACAICGSDLRSFEAGSKHQGQIIGHETIATVIEVGEGVRGFKVGDRVADCPVTCGKCKYCKAGSNNLCLQRGRVGGRPQGGFAELRPVLASAVQGGFVVKVPGDILPEHATLIEPLACVINGQEKLVWRPGASVAILGAGPIGILHLILAKRQGAGKTVLVDLKDERLELARQFGPDYLLNGSRQDPVDETFRITRGEGMDIVIVACVSARAQAQALEMAGRMGQVLFFSGLPETSPMVTLNTNLIHYHELRVVGARSSVKRQWDAALEMIRLGAVDAGAIVTHTVSLEDIVEGFELARSGKALKVAVKP